MIEFFLSLLGMTIELAGHGFNFFAVCVIGNCSVPRGFYVLKLKFHSCKRSNDSSIFGARCNYQKNGLQQKKNKKTCKSLATHTHDVIIAVICFPPSLSLLPSLSLSHLLAFRRVITCSFFFSFFGSSLYINSKMYCLNEIYDSPYKLFPTAPGHNNSFVSNYHAAVSDMKNLFPASIQSHINYILCIYTRLWICIWLFCVLCIYGFVQWPTLVVWERHQLEKWPLRGDIVETRKR